MHRVRSPTSSVDVLDQRGDLLVLDGSATDLSTALTNRAVATGWLVHGHHIVEYGYSTRDGGTAWRCDLAAPCNRGRRDRVVTAMRFAARQVVPGCSLPRAN